MVFLKYSTSLIHKWRSMLHSHKSLSHSLLALIKYRRGTGSCPPTSTFLQITYRQVSRSPDQCHLAPPLCLRSPAIYCRLSLTL